MPSLYRANTPAALKGHMKWLWLGFGSSMSVFLIGMATAMVQSSPRIMGLVGITSVGLMVAGMAASITLLRRDIIYVRRLGGRACPTCLYDLSASSTKGACPECGAPYIQADIICQWRDMDQSYRARKHYTIDD